MKAQELAKKNAKVLLEFRHGVCPGCGRSLSVGHHSCSPIGGMTKEILDAHPGWTYAQAKVFAWSAGVFIMSVLMAALWLVITT